MEVSKKLYWLKVGIIFALGFMGVLSSLPLIPKTAMATGQELPMSVPVLQAISAAQSSVLLFAAVFLGAWLAPKIFLGTPILDAYLYNTRDNLNLNKFLVPAIFWGAVGGIILTLFYWFSRPYLPLEFLANAELFAPPIYTKILYGGITEEVLIRWGLMSFVIWVLFRFTQHKGSPIRDYHYVTGIVLTAFVFGIGHLPAATMYSADVTKALVAYIIIGNSLFGLIAGFLYWRRGLESTIVAHMVAHIVIVIGETIA